MNKFINSLSTLDFWKGFFNGARFFVVISYLSVLSEQDNYVGFWLVVLVFGFGPLVDRIQAMRKAKRNVIDP